MDGLHLCLLSGLDTKVLFIATKTKMNAKDVNGRLQKIVKGFKQNTFEWTTW